MLKSLLRVLGQEHGDLLLPSAEWRRLWSTATCNCCKSSERVLEARRRLFGEDSLDTLSSMNSLSVTLRTQGDLDGARALQERALEARRRVLGEDRLDTLASMNNLATTLFVKRDWTPGSDAP